VIVKQIASGNEGRLVAPELLSLSSKALFLTNASPFGSDPGSPVRDAFLVVFLFFLDIKVVL